MIEIRQGNWNDLKDLVVIKLESLMTANTMQEFFINEVHKRWVNSFSKGMRVLVLIKDQKFSGFLNYYHYYTQNEGMVKLSMIDNIYVIPSLRRQGMGRKLYEVFLQEVKLIDHKLIKVKLEDAHPIMCRFYEALGFSRKIDKKEQGKLTLAFSHQ